MKKKNSFSYFSNHNNNTDVILSTIRFSKKVVVFCISFITIYTVVAVVYQIVTGNILSEVLTSHIFTCILGELGVTGMLKIAENIAEVIQKKNNGDIKTDNLVEEVMEEINTDEYLGGMPSRSYVPFNSSMSEPATISERQD